MARSPAKDEFIEHILDLLSGMGAVSARRMFGGHGIYRGNTMFGLVASQVLYLKADAGNRGLFEAESLEPFTYEGKGKPIQMSYYRAPEQALESPAVMLEWAAHAHAAALRSGARSKKKSTAGKQTAAGKTPSRRTAKKKTKAALPKSIARKKNSRQG
ncbi:MAG: TfoX/Sxy family protein [Leptospirales bacterium]|jgi:DNA transformation protein